MPQKPWLLFLYAFIQFFGRPMYHGCLYNSIDVHAWTFCYMQYTVSGQSPQRNLFVCDIQLCKNVKLGTVAISGVFRISQRGGPNPTHPSLLSLFTSLLPSLLPLPSFPSPTHLPSLPLPSLAPLPPNTAKGYGGALKLPQRIRAERGRQTVSGAF